MKNNMMIPVLIIITLLSACGVNDGGNGEVSVESGNLILTASHGGKGAAWRLPDCAACHAIAAIHAKAGQIRHIVREKGYTTCTGCHGRNGSNESEPRQCVICHNNNDLPHTPRLQGKHAHTFTAGETTLLNDAQCVDCHVASNMDGLFELNRDLTGYADKTQTISDYNSISDFCLRCHNRDHQQTGFEIIGDRFDDPLIAVEDAFYFIDQHGAVDGTGLRTYAGLRPGYEYRTVVACTDCHAMHGTDNTQLIIDNSLKGATLLDKSIRETAHRVTIKNGDYSQLCVLCHQMKVILDDGDLETGNGLSGVHEVGSDCRTCHTHGEAVQAGL